MYRRFITSATETPQKHSSTSSAAGNGPRSQSKTLGAAQSLQEREVLRATVELRCRTAVCSPPTGTPAQTCQSPAQTRGQDSNDQAAKPDSSNTEIHLTVQLVILN